MFIHTLIRSEGSIKLTFESFNSCGRISKYLSDLDRVLEAKGSIDEIIGETTKRVTKQLSTINNPNLCNGDTIDIITALSIKKNNKDFNYVEISVLNINSFENDQYDIDFNIITSDCNYSACSGFDVTFVLEKDGQEFNEIQNIAGWSSGDTNSSTFILTRSGNANGILSDVINIQNPEFECFS